MVALFLHFCCCQVLPGTQSPAPRTQPPAPRTRLFPRLRLSTSFVFSNIQASFPHSSTSFVPTLKVECRTPNCELRTANTEPGSPNIELLQLFDCRPSTALVFSNIQASFRVFLVSSASSFESPSHRVSRSGGEAPKAGERLTGEWFQRVHIVRAIPRARPGAHSRATPWTKIHSLLYFRTIVKRHTLREARAGCKPSQNTPQGL